MAVEYRERPSKPEQDARDFWLPHVVLIATIAGCLFAGVLPLAPFMLFIAAVALRSRMLLFAGLGLVLLFLAFLVLAGGIGGSVGGGLVDSTSSSSP
jgi:hypothetical protein